MPERPQRHLHSAAGMIHGTGWIEDERLVAVFAAALLGAVLWPIRQNWREDKRDGFPLSYYPMFSQRRKSHVDLYYVVGLTTSGERRLIPYSYAGTGGLNQVRRQLRRLVRSGEGGVVCEAVAKRLAAKSNGPLSDVVTVRVVSGRFRLANYFAGDKEPLSERIHATRPIDRDA